MITPTITELWHEADGLIRLSMPLLAKLVDPHYNLDEANRPEYRRQLDECNERLSELRKQLLALVKPWFIWFDNGDIFSMPPNLPHQPTTDELRRYAAACLFAAWEIEQRATGSDEPQN